MATGYSSGQEPSTLTRTFHSLPLSWVERSFAKIPLHPQHHPAPHETSEKLSRLLTSSKTIHLLQVWGHSTKLKQFAHSHAAQPATKPEQNLYFLNPKSTAIPGISLHSLKFGPVSFCPSYSLFNHSYTAFRFTINALRMFFWIGNTKLDLVQTLF